MSFRATDSDNRPRSSLNNSPLKPWHDCPFVDQPVIESVLICVCSRPAGLDRLAIQHALVLRECSATLECQVDGQLDSPCDHLVFARHIIHDPCGRSVEYPIAPTHEN